MNLTNSPLAVGSTHPDVKVLPEELTLLGFTLAEAEIETGRFGQSIRQTVLVFQRTRDLAVGGTVDKEMAVATNGEKSCRY